MTGIRAEAINDSTRVVHDTITLSLSNHKSVAKPLSDTTRLAAFKPDPSRAVWLAAIVPGLGQIYNRKYWKLPLVYGGFVGFIYAVSWNNRMYNDYRKAYLDLTDNNPNTQSYWNLLPAGTVHDLSQLPGGVSWLTNALKTRVEGFRRYRDLSIICTIGWYALSVIDAYVDAQLSDFDVSPDLSMKITPTVINTQREIGSNATVGLRFKVNF
jgi:hypothetical protein